MTHSFSFGFVLATRVSAVMLAAASILQAGEASMRQNATDGLPVLRRLQNDGRLDLSTTRPAAGKPFHFILRMPATDGEDLVISVHALQERTSVLLCSADGLPLWYLTEHLVIGLDPDYPGGLVVTDREVPVVRFGTGDEGQIDIGVVGSTKDAKGLVELNVGSLLRGGRVKVATYDALTGHLRLRHPNSTADIEVTDNPEFPVASISFRSDAGPACGAFGITVGPTTRPVEIVTRSAIENLGVPLRQVASFETTFHPAPSLLRNAKCRDTAEKFSALLERDLPLRRQHAAPPASQPATGRSTDTTRPAGDAEADVSGEATLRRLLADERLRLSTEPPRATARFSFALSWLVSGETIHALACVENDRTSVVVCSSRGLPLVYMSEHLFVGLDRDQPGGLLIAKPWVPVFEFSTKDGGINLDATGSATRASGLVTLDLHALLAGEAKRVIHDQATKSLTIRRPHSIDEFCLTAGPGFPVSSYTYRGDDGLVCRAHDIVVGPEAHRPANVTQAAVEGLGIPTRIQVEDLKVPMDANGDVINDPRHRAAAQGLAKLLERELSILVPPKPVQTSRPTTDSARSLGDASSTARIKDNAAAVLARLVSDENLRLRTPSQSSLTPKRYHFVFDWRQPGGEAYRCVVCVEPGRTSALVSSPDGHPLWYLTEHLSVALDPDRPGQILMNDRWVPAVTFAPNADGGLRAMVFGSKTDPSGIINVDLHALLDAGGRLEAATLNEAKKSLLMTREKGDVSVTLNDARSGGFAISGLTISGRTGFSCGVSGIVVGEHACKPAAITREDINGLGLPSQVNRENHPDPWTISTDVLKSEEARKASEKLAGLFPDQLKLLGSALGETTTRPDRDAGKSLDASKPTEINK